MKEKRMKGSTRKVLLMGVAAVLVAAISVGATLAYLTAQTASVTNKFTGSGGITGNVLEPHYETDETYTYTTGKPQSKDPLVANTTADAAIWTGARVSFFIDVNNDYVQVTEAVFRQYVDIQYNGTDGFNTQNALTANEASGYPSGEDKWVKMTTTSANDTAAGKSSYFMYDRVLKKADTNAAYDGINDGSANHTAAIDVSKYSKGDSTLPIFTTVTVKNDVRIESGLADSAYTTSIDPTNTASGTGPSGKTFKKFNYKIIVNGYGEKAYAVDTSGNGTGDVLCRRSEAAAEILTKLEGLTNATPTAANP